MKVEQYESVIVFFHLDNTYISNNLFKWNL